MNGRFERLKGLFILLPPFETRIFLLTMCPLGEKQALLSLSGIWCQKELLELQLQKTFPLDGVVCGAGAS